MNIFLCCTETMLTRICASEIHAADGQAVTSICGRRPVSSSSRYLADSLASGGGVGEMMANCRCGVVTLMLYCWSHCHAVTLYPFRDNRSQKKLILPGMWCASNVNVLKNSVHRASLPRDGLGMYADRIGASKMC